MLRTVGESHDDLPLPIPAGVRLGRVLRPIACGTVAGPGEIAVLGPAWRVVW
jgi:hypothetical protein